MPVRTSPDNQGGAKRIRYTWMTSLDTSGNATSNDDGPDVSRSRKDNEADAPPPRRLLR